MFNLGQISRTLFDFLVEDKKINIDELARITKFLRCGFVGLKETEYLVFRNELGEIMKIPVWYEIAMEKKNLAEQIHNNFFHYINCSYNTHRNSSDGRMLCSCFSTLKMDNNNADEIVYVSMRRFGDNMDGLELANIMHLLGFANKYPGFQRYLRIYSLAHGELHIILDGASDRGLKIYPTDKGSHNENEKILVVAKKRPQGENIFIVNS